VSLGDQPGGRIRPINATLVIWSAVLVIALAGAFLFVILKQSPRLQQYDDPVYGTIVKCRQDLIAEVHPKAIDVALADQISNHCITEIYGAKDLEDFSVRRAAFVEQYAEGHFVIWLVVAITISGIALAAIQLAAAYNLSVMTGKALEAGATITAEPQKITFTSSVSGLAILVISFAFFFSYIKFVYPVEATDVVKNHDPKTIPVPASPPPGSPSPPIGVMTPNLTATPNGTSFLFPGVREKLGAPLSRPKPSGPSQPVTPFPPGNPTPGKSG
jgi:hypothetical protein